MLILPRCGLLTLLFLLTCTTLTPTTIAHPQGSILGIAQKKNKGIRGDESNVLETTLRPLKGNAASARGVPQARSHKKYFSFSSFDSSSTSAKERMPDNTVDENDKFNPRRSTSRRQKLHRIRRLSPPSVAPDTHGTSQAYSTQEMPTLSNIGSEDDNHDHNGHQQLTPFFSQTEIGSSLRDHNPNTKGDILPLSNQYSDESHPRVRKEDRDLFKNDRHLLPSSFSWSTPTQHSSNDIQHQDGEGNVDKYAGIRQEIEKLGRRLGSLPAEAGVGDVDEDGHDEDHIGTTNSVSRRSGEVNKILTRGIAQTIDDLLSMQKSLLGSKFGGGKEDNETKYPTFTKTFSTEDITTTTDKLWEDGLEVEKANSKAKNNSTFHSVSKSIRNRTEEAERAAFGTSVPTSGEKGRGGNAATNKADTNVGAETSAMGLVALASVLFIAAVTIMIVAYLHVQRHHTRQTQPCYPPRGPAFV